MDQAKFVHWDELIDLSLEDSVKIESEKLYLKVKTSEEDCSENKAVCLMRCCALVVSRSQTVKTVEGVETLNTYINISSFLKNTSKELNLYQTYLDRIKISLPEKLALSLQELIRNIEISKVLFIKFKDIWEKIQLKGNSTFVSSMMQFVWILLINLKFSLKISSIFECGYLILAIFDVFLKNLRNVSFGLSQPYTTELCSFLGANSDQSQIWVGKVEKCLSTYLQRGNLFSKNFELSGAFKSSVLSKNMSLLSNLYDSQMDQSNFDERDLILLKQNIRTPQKPRFMRQNKPHEIMGKVLKWDENLIGPTINSKLNEVNMIPASPFIPPPTPMSMVMELNNWFVDLIDLNKKDANLKVLISDHAISVIRIKINDSLERTKKVFEQRDIGTKSIQGLKFISEHFEAIPLTEIQEKNTRIEELNSFFYIVFTKILKKEQEKDNDVERLALNEEFLSGVFAICLEALLFTHSVICINFEEVLELSGSNSFDFWKVINPFFQFDNQIPHSLRRHFREIEVKILSCLAWTEGSKVNLSLKEMLTNGEDRSETSLFLKRLLSHSANRILELTNSLSLSESVKEEIWSTFKYILSEKTEILFNRHADHLIVCSIYGVCKVSSTIEFKNIIEKYRQLYLEDSNFFKRVYINKTHYDTIIFFYNNVFIQAAKEFITHQIHLLKPRLEVLNPSGPLRASIPTQMTNYVAIQSLIKSPLKSPFRTPRSDALWATNETFSPLRKTTEIQAINFDRPMMLKKPKIFDEILNAKDEVMGPAPTLKKNVSEEYFLGRKSEGEDKGLLKK